MHQTNKKVDKPAEQGKHMEASIINGLVSQAPGMVGVIIVVAYFLKSIEKRDSLFIDQMNKMTDRLAGIETKFASHDEKSTNDHNAVMDGVKRIEAKLNKRKQ